MQLSVRDDLPFVFIQVVYRGRELMVPDVLVDTGSASTILAADVVAAIGIIPEAIDSLRLIQGIDGTEAAFVRVIDRLQVDDRGLLNFELEVGGLDYGLGINGILGMDFLMAAGAVIDLKVLQLRFADGS